MIKNTLKITAPISPYSENDTYPTHDSKYGNGGYHEVKTIEERNAIPESRRKIGMMVCVQEPTQVWYVLQNGIENSNYVDFSTILSGINYGNLIVLVDEPSTPSSTTVWLNPITGIIMYRNTENTEWLELNSETVIDGGTF